MTNQNVAKRAFGAVVACVIVLMSLAIAPLSHAATGMEKTPAGLNLYTSGHIDALNVHGNSSGVELNLREDVTGLNVMQDPSNVILGVTDDAWTDLTATVPNIETNGFFLPQTQNHAVIWPGFNSMDTVDFAEVSYKIESLDGPGDVFLFGAGAFGGLTPRTESGSWTLGEGETFTHTYARHEHINWLFTDPGTYLMDVSATVTFNDGTVLTTDTQTYTWAVGNETVDQARNGLLDPKVEVTPEAVSFDTENFTYTVPATEGVDYSVQGEVVAAGEHNVEPPATITVSAAPQQGYEFPEGATTSWSATFEVPDVVVTPGDVTFNPDNLTYTIPETEGVSYLVDGAIVEAGEHTVEPPVTIQVTALARDGYQIEEGATTSWGYEFARPDQIVTPEDVTFDDEANTYTVPEVEGVTYVLAADSSAILERAAFASFEEIAAGTYEVTPPASITINAVAADGYALAVDSTTSWSHEFSLEDQVVTPEDVTFDDEANTYTVPEVEGVIYTLAVDSSDVSDETSFASSEEVVAGTHSVTPPATITITAVADEGFTFSEEATTSWSHEFVAPEDDEEPGDDTTPGDDQTPGDDTTPGDDQTPGDDTTPGDDQTPGDDTTPGDDQASGDDQTPGDNAGIPAPGTGSGPSNPGSGQGQAPSLPGGGGAPSAPAAPQCIPTEVKTKVDAPAAGPTGSTSGSHTVPANTHVHPNWVFSEPGDYALTLQHSATIDGETHTATGVVTFRVGGQGNADSGHFDVGTSFENGELKLLIKDDRQVPATWVAPDSVIFGLSDAASVTAPAGIEFVADEGDTVWMVSSSQVQGVPWVGANTQHPSLGGTTEVEWSLVSATGPGKVAVFESGNFGEIVGARWFDGSGAGGGSTSAAPEAGVIEENGEFFKIEYVGKTKDGADCELIPEQVAQLQAEGKNVSASNLAKTGADAMSLAGMSALLIVAGSLLVMRRRAA